MRNEAPPLADPIEKIYISYDDVDERCAKGVDLLEAAIGSYAVTRMASLEEADAVIAVGGDGAFARAVREHGFSSIPMAGISTGKLGWYMGTVPTKESVDYLVRNLAEGDYSLVNLPIVELRNEREELVAKAVNEIIIKAPGFQAFVAKIIIDGTQFDNFVGGGLEFVTPQGSTGEGISDNGPMIAEGTPVWAMVPKSPHISDEYYAPASPFVMHKDWEVVVEVKDTFRRPFVVGGDGQDIEWHDGDVLKLTMSKDDPLRRIRLKDHSYADDIARKFRGQKK